MINLLNALSYFDSDPITSTKDDSVIIISPSNERTKKSEEEKSDQKNVHTIDIDELTQYSTNFTDQRTITFKFNTTCTDKNVNSKFIKFLTKSQMKLIQDLRNGKEVPKNLVNRLVLKDYREYLEWSYDNMQKQIAREFYKENKKCLRNCSFALILLALVVTGGFLVYFLGYEAGKNWWRAGY